MICVILVLTLISRPLVEGAQIDRIEQDHCEQHLEIQHSIDLQADSSDTNCNDDHQDHNQHHTHTCSSCYVIYSNYAVFTSVFGYSNTDWLNQALHPFHNPNNVYRPPRQV